jgi:hypothetical protein
MPELLIGWASKDITPSRPVLLKGQWHVRVSTHVEDPLTATALALQTSSGSEPEQAVLVSCDLLCIPSSLLERVRAHVRKRLPQLDPLKLFLNATHTHTAPEVEDGWYPHPGGNVMMPAEYVDFVAERIGEAVVGALNGRQAGGVSWALGHAVIGHNRRVTYLDGHSQMYGKTNDPNFDCIEGYEDHSIGMLFTWTPFGRLTGLVLNLACPSQMVEGENYVSADFWHDVRAEIRRRRSPDLFILPQCSAAGDQSPHLLLYERAEAETRRKRGVTERQEAAERVATAVDHVFGAAQGDIRTDIPFRHCVETLELPLRRLSRDEFEAAQEYVRLHGQSADAPGRLFFEKETVARYRLQEGANPPSIYPLELHVLRLGDVAMATNPFELFLDYGLRMKARSRALQTFVIQLACDSRGYLPTERAIRARGYGAEVLVSVVGPEGGQVLVDHTVELINGMWP